MGSESSLRRRHREAIRSAYPRALVVSQPASAYTGAGRTDLYVIVEGRYVGLELKTSMGCATQVQLDRIRKVRQAGGYAAVVRHPDQSLELIRHALAGGSVWDNLFNEDEKPDPEGGPTKGQVERMDALDLEQIRAFKEPEIQREIELNGVSPAGDGAMIEPPSDYPFGVIIQRLDRLEALIRYFMVAAGVEEKMAEPPPAAAEPLAGVPTETESAASPPASRSRSKKQK